MIQDWILAIVYSILAALALVYVYRKGKAAGRRDGARRNGSQLQPYSPKFLPPDAAVAYKRTKERALKYVNRER